MLQIYKIYFLETLKYPLSKIPFRKENVNGRNQENKEKRKNEG